MARGQLTMSTGSISRAIRLGGVPVVLLTLFCTVLGTMALSFDAGAAMALYVAGVGALLVFLFIAGPICPD